mgnify:CR=1 FL=1
MCDQKTVVSLTVDGTAKIGAYTFDDGSHDNCAIDYFEVKRMDDGVPCDSTFKNTINIFFCRFVVLNKQRNNFNANFNVAMGNNYTL